jgi:hypothetical protein
VCVRERVSRVSDLCFLIVTLTPGILQLPFLVPSANGDGDGDGGGDSDGDDEQQGLCVLEG